LHTKDSRLMTSPAADSYRKRVGSPDDVSVVALCVRDPTA
jgi:hypothetical protein